MTQAAIEARRNEQQRARTLRRDIGISVPDGAARTLDAINVI